MMDLFNLFQKEQRGEDTCRLFESDYLNQLSRIEEKFKRWKNMDFLARAAVFSKVAVLSRCYDDTLTKLVVQEMEILLENSETDC
ncbi:acyl-CoA reductase-like NAD-dependent aldehyde dehydrogenase [Pedobacter sp. UYEF25]